MDTENHHYLRWLSRTLIIRVGGVIGLALMMWLLPSLTVDNLFTGFAYVAVVAILNARLWPILSRIFLPFMGFTLGFGALVLNGLMLWLGSMFIEGVTFDGLLSYIPAAFGIALINTIISSLLTIDDDVSNYRNVLHRRMHTEEKENLSASIQASSF